MAAPSSHGLTADRRRASTRGGPLRIGLNLTYLVEDSGGSGTYARQLMAHLLALEPSIELTAWVGATAPEDLRSEPWAGEVRWIRLPVPGIGTPWHLWHELVAIGIDAARRRIDVVHGLANLVPVVHPGSASIVTILDVIWIHHPDAMELRARAVMRVLAPTCGHLATRVIAISHAAAEDISRTLKIPASRFDVTPLGIIADRGPRPVNIDAVRQELELGSEPLVLCVAAKRAHKNLDGLIRALALIEEPRAQLLLPGSPTEYERRLRELARDLGLEARVHFPGWVSREQLEALYAMAACFVLPSFQEGFGLPVLEAMRRRVPVACSGVSSLPEVAGDAALLFDPGSPRSMADAIRRLLVERELAATLVERGEERCRTFTWRRTAELTLASYHRAIERREARCMSV
jgi:glycosyltransferase involved in cell wall biosynthesis